MKRPHSLATSTLSTRMTRSATRRKQEKAHKDREVRHRANRALEQSNFEKALSVVLCNGFLYRHECVSAALACKGCNDVWEENKHDLAEVANVEVLLEMDPCSGCGVHRPHWLSDIVEENERDRKECFVSSHAFLRQVYDKVNRLEIAAIPSKKKRLELKEAAPKWGEGITQVSVRVWDANRPPILHYGGIVLRFHQMRELGSWKEVLWVHLRPDLTLSGASNIGRRAQRLYDQKPLWP